MGSGWCMDHHLLSATDRLGTTRVPHGLWYALNQRTPSVPAASMCLARDRSPGLVHSGQTQYVTKDEFESHQCTHGRRHGVQLLGGANDAQR